MDWRRTALVSTVVVLIATSRASASPPPAVALERRIAEVKSIFVGSLRSQPVRCGDAYDVSVEETLKGDPPGLVVRVRAPYHFNGCIVRENDPPPKALEAGAKRALFFAADEKDGARDTWNVVTLDPDAGMSATFWIGVYASYRASFGPDAVRALVELDAPRRDAKSAAELWVKGLAGANPILVEALLDRFRIVAGGDPARSAVAPNFGDELVQRAQRDAAVAPKELLAAVLAHCGDALPPHQTQALACAAEAYGRAGPEERPLFEKAIAAARANARAGVNDVRDVAVWLLVAADDADAVAALVDLMRRKDQMSYQRLQEVALAAQLAHRGGARRDEAVGAVVALVDEREEVRGLAMEALRKMTGEGFTDAPAWKHWWAARRK